MAFSPDCKQVVSGSRDRTVRLWDVVTGAGLQTLEGHLDSVNSVPFSPDVKQVVSGSFDKTVRLWDAVMGAALQTLEGHSNSVKSVAFSPDMISAKSKPQLSPPERRPPASRGGGDLVTVLVSGIPLSPHFRIIPFYLPHVLISLNIDLPQNGGRWEAPSLWLLRVTNPWVHTVGRKAEGSGGRPLINWEWMCGRGRRVQGPLTWEGDLHYTAPNQSTRHRLPRAPSSWGTCQARRRCQSFDLKMSVFLLHFQTSVSPS